MDQPQPIFTKVITPRSEYIPPSPLDIHIGHFTTGSAHFFLKPPNIERMKIALAMTLDRHPSFGASMVREANMAGLCCGEADAEFSVRRSDSSCPDFRSTQSLLTDTAITSDRHTDYPFNCGAPVACFRLVLFKDRGCALWVQHFHNPADGMSTVQFLENWSLAYHGKAPRPAQHYQRANTFALDTQRSPLPGKKPDTRQQFAEKHTDGSDGARNRGSIRIDIAQALLENYLHDCRLHSRLSLSSSEIIHALVWKCGGLTRRGHDLQFNRLYSTFDTRGDECLGVPNTHEWSAVPGRYAKASYAALRGASVAELALLFHRQMNPITAAEIGRHVGHPAHEHLSTHIDKSGGHTNFHIGAWRDCRDERGLVVNDLRKLAKADIVFEDRPARMEILYNDEIDVASIYENDDGTTTIHYAGEISTLSHFAENIRYLLKGAARNEHEREIYFTNIEQPD